MSPSVEILSEVGYEASPRRSVRVEKLKKAWREGLPPDTLEALTLDPELAADRVLALDLAYEEFCVRIEAGEVLDAEAFCAQFPFANSLLRLLNLHEFFDEHPDVLAGVPARWPGPEEALGDFMIQRELGRGGFSRVYLARETSAGGRPVVLKISAGSSHEAQTLGPLSHPHLIPVLSSPTIGNWKIVAMPFVGKATLEHVLSVAWHSGDRNARLSGRTILDAATSIVHVDDPSFSSLPDFPISPSTGYEEAIQSIAARLFSALAYLHRAGVAHRDIKPSNVLVGPTGHPYLLDFNLAATGKDPLSAAGTIPYMSPEQLRLFMDSSAQPPEDCRPSDIFSCGVVFFELLTGQHPFGDFRTRRQGIAEPELAKQVNGAQLAGQPPLARLNRRASKRFRSAIERCLSRDPQSRPTAQELAELLDNRQRRAVSRWLLRTGVAGGLSVMSLGAFAANRGSQFAHYETPTEHLAVPSDPYEHALLLLEKNEFGLAAGDFLKIGRQAQDGRAYALAAYCYSLKKDQESAVIAADRAIENGFATAAVYANRAHNHLLRKRFEKSKEDSDKALQLDPHLRAAHFTRAQIYFTLAIKNNDFSPPPEEVIADIQFVVRGGPNPQKVCFVAAYLFALAGERDTRFLDDSADFVLQAIMAGKPISVFETAPFTSRLHDHPVYRQALTLTPGSESTPDQLQLVHPLSNR